MEKWTNNLELKGEKITLKPLQYSHKEALIQAASDGKLWQLWHTSVPSAKSIDKYLDSAIRSREEGTAIPFVVIENKTEKIIGSTRYCNIEQQHRRLEIGYTWYAVSFQRSGVNTECKYLMLKNAFESLNCICVQFLTNWHNLKSRSAILGLGAKQDGVLRNHRINLDGSYRDTVVFSILDNDWLNVKKNLEYKLSKYRAKPS